MATTISGKLINGIGEPIKNCKITLKSISTSTTVIAHTTASQTPSAAGDYSMSVEPGKYTVTLSIDGFPPEYVGDIQVYKDSPSGTLNYFLGLPQDDDLRPDAIKNFEAMVDKVASQVAEVEKSKLAAEGSARSAAASADRASQITGLSTVTDAISMASVPLPDVWIPFNDSLQMITGYGEEVKVGAVTVAKMVSFSRATTATYIDKSGNMHIAGVNEPRLERNSLRIECQSTNLCERSSEIVNFWADNGSPLAEDVSDGFTKITPSGPFSGKYFIPTTKLNIGSKYSISFWAYADGNVDNTRFVIGAEKEATSGGVIRSLTTTPKRYELTFTATQEVPSIVAYSETGISPFYVKNFQLEKKPYSSSYIPTNGTQITRADDVVTLHSQNNWDDIKNCDVTVCAQVSNLTPDGAFPGVFSYDDRNESVYYSVVDQNFSSTEVQKNMLSASILDVSKTKLYAERHTNSDITVYLDNKGFGVKCGRVMYPRYASSITLFNRRGQYFNGYIRNLRIWHSSLSDEQIKALK
ncbi:prophage tail fiber N-terminal domain-containing protein [Edwardsiella tarda]|uniref:prophage tail fiber N-terminal domain-containing protein n=1 Tax=Edwardsiella tarda TaxID=636 RepID=UPI00098F7DE4|nr:prophage tail fiber N-terminal domain-containing protein [Edwardsiella tarda]